MKRIAAFLILAAAAMAQPSISVGVNAPSGATCGSTTVGNIYVRSGDTANAPIGVFRCTQTGSVFYSWQSIDHFTGDTLPTKCAVGDIAYKTNATAGQNLYGCTSADTWTAQGGGTSLAFSSITAGTNTNALVVGTGGTLGTSGTGTIAGWADSGTTISAATGRSVTIPLTSTPTTPASGFLTCWYPNISPGEIACKDSSGNVTQTVNAGGISGDVQVNNGGIFGAAPINCSGGNCSMPTGTFAIGNTVLDGTVTGTIGTAAVKNIGTSGATVPLLSTANTWTLGQTFDNITLSNTTSALGIGIVPQADHMVFVQNGAGSVYNTGTLAGVAAHLLNTPTSVSDALLFGGSFNSTWAGTQNSPSGISYGVHGQAQSNVTTPGVIGVIVAGDFLAFQNSSGTITGNYGVRSSALNQSTGVVTSNYSGYFGTGNFSSSAITSNYGVYIPNPAGSGAITTNYGLYIETQTKGGTNYGIYSNGASNYLGGSLQEAAVSAASTPALYLTGAIFTGGSGTTTFPHVLIQPSTATASTTWSTSGTPFGINAHTGIGNLVDFQVDGSSKFSIAASGTVTGGSYVSSNSFQSASAGGLIFGARSIIDSLADGNIRLTNNGHTDFLRLSLGPDTTSFPALCHSGTTLQVMLGGACTTDAPMTASNVTISGSSITIGGHVCTAGTGTFVCT